MSGRNKAIVAGVFFSLVVIVGIVVAVLIAFKQTAEKPVAPTVPQIKPRAEAPATTQACSLSFTVIAPQTVVCDSLTVDPSSGTAPLTITATLAGHATPSGSIVNYQFNFGDGTAPLGQPGNTINHTYSSEGTFTVKGAVADNLGNTAGGSGGCQQTVTVGHVIYKFKKCANNACIEQDCSPNSTPCSGLSNCQVDSDCKPKFTHRVCLGSSCSSVDCSPPTVACADSCTSDVSCVPIIPPPPAAPSATHRICQNRACVLVAGAGTSTCSSDVSCQPKATPPPIPKSGNTALTIGGIILGMGALVVGLLILL